jgi:hypothetical protein
MLSRRFIIDVYPALWNFPLAIVSGIADILEAGLCTSSTDAIY